MNFQSDNQSSVFPEIIDYLKLINEDSSPAYGADEVTKLATKMLTDLFETNLKVIFVSSGTAANSIALSSICPPYGGILCSDNAHIGGDECGAPEFFTGGAKLLTIPTDNALITEKKLITKMNNHGLHGIHEVLHSVISLTQASELGTIYTPDDINKVDLYKNNSLSNATVIQFYHRLIAYILVVFLIILNYFFYKQKIERVIKVIYSICLSHINRRDFSYYFNNLLWALNFLYKRR